MTDRATKAVFESGLELLTAASPWPDYDVALRHLVADVEGADRLQQEGARRMAELLLADRGVPDARRLVAAAFAARNGNAAGASAHRELTGQAIAFTDPEPWPDPVDGAELLARLHAFTARFLGLPTGAHELFAVFAVATYVVELFPSAPYVVVHSPAPQCGKTRALEVLAALVRRPWLTIVPSTAVLFRVLEQSSPTLLLDEAEVVHGRGDAAADVRALLQSGYRRGAFVPRCVGESNEVRNFRVFGPKVFALIGELPAALLDRCIRVEMQRRNRGEQLERFRPTRLEPEALVLRRMARRWVSDHALQLGEADPEPLDALDERQQEVWDPLFAVGLIAGGGWYDRLVGAAEHLSAGRAAATLGLTLLADVRSVLAASGGDRISSADLATALNALEGRPWADRNRGKGLTANGLARLLAPFGVSPTTVRIADRVAKGYLADRFGDAFARYLAPQPLQPTQASQDGPYPTDSQPLPVTVSNDEIVAESGHCNGVTVEKHGEAGVGDVGDAWEPEP